MRKGLSMHRPVMINGTVYTDHELIVVTLYPGNGEAVLTVASRADGVPSIEHSTSVPFADRTWAEWEAIVWELPDYAEWEDATPALLDEVLAILTDEQAEQVPNAYPLWEADVAYRVGQRVRHDSKLYRCVQAHTSQWGWEPPSVPALWVRTSQDAIPEWVQPTGAHDAYAKGDKVRHNGDVWVSDIDANVYEPGVFGWLAV